MLGSLAVFFNKQRSHIETVNDIDEEIVNFFRILRDRSDELERAIEFTPFSRSEYKAAYEPSYNDLERARRFAVKCFGWDLGAGICIRMVLNQANRLILQIRPERGANFLK